MLFKRNVSITVCFDFRVTARPVSANHLFSIPVRSDRPIKCASGPGQL